MTIDENAERGQLSVYYTEDRPFIIPDEQSMLNALAESLGGLFEGKRAEETLRLLSSVVEQSSEGIVVSDLTEGG